MCYGGRKSGKESLSLRKMYLFSISYKVRPKNMGMEKQ